MSPLPRWAFEFVVIAMGLLLLTLLIMGAAAVCWITVVGIHEVIGS